MIDTLHTVLTVSTVNVNGLRAAAGKGYREWLAATTADVVCLQEIRATAEQLPDVVRAPDGWRTAVHVPAAAKGRAGVSVLARRAALDTAVGIDAPEFADAGRFVQITLPTVVIGSLYLPSGDVGTPKQDEKERFMAAFLPYLVDLRQKAAADGREVLICGDWNIAHTRADLRNWRGNQNASGFLPSERAWLDTVFGDGGYVDVVRTLHPDIEGPYSWWTYRGRAFDNDTGWRIDLHAATPALAATAASAVVERAETHDQRWSDHAPVTVSYRFPKR